MAISEPSGRGTYAYAAIIYERLTWVHGRGGEFDEMITALEMGESLMEQDLPGAEAWIRIAAVAHRQIAALIARREAERAKGKPDGLR